MGGLKKNIIENTLKIYGSDYSEGVFCGDNDEAGINLLNNLKNQNIALKTLLPDFKYKDWNEQLQNMKGEQYEDNSLSNCRQAGEKGTNNIQENELPVEETTM
jgi:hypothetical protein